MKKFRSIALVIASISIASGAGFYFTSTTKANDTAGHVQEQVTIIKPATEIKEKMLNAIDNYQTVQGAYRNVTKNRNITVDFEVEQGSNPYSRILVKDKAGIKKESISDKNTLIEFDVKHKTYTKDDKSKINDEKVAVREFKDSKNEKHMVHRSDPATAQDAQLVTFPQQIAFWLKDDEKNYSIVGSETILNRNATVIEGKLTSTLSEKFGSKFKLWVDTETGVLLKLLTFDAQQNETSRIEVLNIEFNKSLTHKYRTDDTKGFTNIKESAK
ncbi:sigma-E factor regulatory protein RseB domain-containing protein [Paenibacillus oleatilyticus]|uniref:sigma-E factor regulatory protein RseB domain-containing protein n=1 Tax=Paenibacillus oleatilyticus TaxID=2594886 RepID=UPI001C1F84B3|nr:sigma-E factor regulatory protein RseB domain-containing protein [Paenibacillus oleatilyticus]MBU7315373.1 hypothetical protein [Paenibacillus oleatilyticus]